jgi:sugar lactone lactonase YvrE
VALVFAVAGCHRPLKPIFAQPKPPITWPADPDRARIQYVGRLTSPADLKPRRKLLTRVAEVFVGKKTPEQLSGPRSVVTTGGGKRAWIADPGGRCLHLFDLQQRTYKKITRAGEQPLLSPSGLCAGPDETIFVCDAEGVAIHQLSGRTGGLRRSLRLPDEVERPVALSYDGTTETLFVVDVAAHNVKVLGLDGRLIRIIGRRGVGPGDFNYPCDITMDNRPETGATPVVWIADTGNQRVQGLTYAGESLVTFGEAGDAPGEMALPKGIATDSEGNVYVVDARFENVQIFDRSGRLLLIVGEEGIGPGQFWLPSGIFIDSNDRIWICDTYNRRVQVLEKCRKANGG